MKSINISVKLPAELKAKTLQTKINKRKQPLALRPENKMPVLFNSHY
jgi:hypothetical protein